MNPNEAASLMSAGTLRVVEALAISAPWALFVHFDELSHCLEASVSGVEILRRHGVNAKCIPCSVVAWRENKVVAAGVSAETLERRFPNERVLIDKPTFHCAIEVEDRLILDLTLGQICAYGVDVTPTFVTACGFEAKFKTADGWNFTYEHETWFPEELMQFEECSHTGLTEDLAVLAKLVLKVGREGFYDALPHAISPTEAFVTALKRLTTLRQKSKTR